MIKYYSFNIQILIKLFFLSLFLFNCEGKKESINHSLDIKAAKHPICGSWKFSRELFQREQNKIK